jgi:MFS family permease
LLGAGAGMMYCYPLKCAMDWNPRRKGIISGILLSGLGFGAFTWNMIATFYINPTNKSTGKNGENLDEEEYNRVPSLFLLLGAIYSVLLFIAHVILIRPAED